MFNFQQRRAVVINGHDPIFTFTSAQDIAAIVAKAIDYEGEWPTIGGISGNKVFISQIIKIGEEVRGKSVHLFMLTG